MIEHRHNITSTQNIVIFLTTSRSIRSTLRVRRSSYDHTHSHVLFIIDNAFFSSSQEILCKLHGLRGLNGWKINFIPRIYVDLMGVRVVSECRSNQQTRTHYIYLFYLYRISRLHKSIFKSFSYIRSLPYSTRLTRLDLQPLYVLRNHLDFITCFRLIHGLTHLNYTSLFGTLLLVVIHIQWYTLIKPPVRLNTILVNFPFSSRPLEQSAS